MRHAPLRFDTFFTPCAAARVRQAFWPQRALGALLLATGLLACGGGGGGSEAPAPSARVLRELPADMAQRQAVAYSPYRSGTRDSETITQAMIAQDLALLVKAGYGLIRLFDSSDRVAKAVLHEIASKGLNIKVMLGVWISPNAEAANQAEIARGVALANAYKDQVQAVSVGNETLVSWTAHPQTSADLARYISQTRAAISQPVTTDDNWAVWAAKDTEQSPKAVLDVVDFVAVHTYPLIDSVKNPQLWDWKQEKVPAAQRAAAMMDAALARAQTEFAAVTTHLAAQGLAHMPALIGETGWKAQASGGEVLRAHPVNQQMYWERMQAWKASGKGPRTVVHFAAFDEPWKQGDDKWGLFNVQRQARCVVAGSGFEREAGSCEPAAALHHVPTQAATPVTANRYTVFADGVTAGEARPTSIAPNAWENNSTATAELVTNDAAASDGPSSWKITPKPLSWGWGMAFALSEGVADLSAFDSANGYLNFSVKTTYTGKIEVGFLTGVAADSTLFDAYVVIAPGEHGYQNNGQWQQVRVPIRSLMAAGAPAYGMPNSAVIRMDQVSNLLVVADRFDKTKNTAANATAPIWIDAVFWSK